MRQPDTPLPIGRCWKRRTFPCHPDTTGHLADDGGSLCAPVSLLGLSGMGVILLADHHRTLGADMTVVLVNVPHGVACRVACRVTETEARAAGQWVLRGVFHRELSNRDLLGLIGRTVEAVRCMRTRRGIGGGGCDKGDSAT